MAGDRRHLRSRHGGSIGDLGESADGGLAFTNGTGWEPFDFDAHLASSIPEQLSICIANRTAGLEEDGFLVRRSEDITANPVLSKSSQTVTSENKQDKRRGFREVGSRDYSDSNGHKKREDNLGDLVYFAYHKRREKEEKKMTNLDKSKLLSDYDTFREYLVKLESFSTPSAVSDALIRTLAKITKLNNIADECEVELKYTLTMRELRMFIRTYDEWKQREAALKKQQVDNNFAYESDSDGDENLPLAKLRRKRLHKRAMVYGPIVKINFLENVTLVIDPLLPPKVIRRSD